MEKNFINGGRGDHFDSPIFNNRLDKEKVNSWYTGTIITAVTSQYSKPETDNTQFPQLLNLSSLHTRLCFGNCFSPPLTEINTSIFSDWDYEGN